MDGRERLRSRFSDSMSGAGSAGAAADLLCLACVELLDVDGASIALVRAGASQGTFGASSPQSRLLDEYQFTFGEGPCLDSVKDGRPVLVTDLDDPAEQRWPAFRAAVLADGVSAVFALPIEVAATRVGALDLFREEPGPWSDQAHEGARIAAELAAVPMLALMSMDFAGEDDSLAGDGWQQLAALDRVEVYQATGMVMGALGVSAADALVRLRAYAFAQGLTASDVAWQVVERRLLPGAGDWQRVGPSPSDE